MLNSIDTATLERAKKLHAAGFVPPRLNEHYNWNQEELLDEIMATSLEELIEATDVQIIVRGSNGLWYADEEEGATPADAVANHWLALHQKS